MKYLKFIFAGIIFGIILTKSEVLSWYRINEMFHFESFHMFGIIGSAILIGILIVRLTNKYKIKSMKGAEIKMSPKPMMFKAYLFGGIIFGLGWALAGACPGPMYTLIGNGFSILLLTLASALIGTITYGALRDKLPH